MPYGADIVLPPCSMVVSPVQWAVLALLAILVFAPKLLPPLARLAGRSLGGWLRAALGLPALQRPTAPRAEIADEPPTVQVIRPSRREHTLRAGSRSALADRAPDRRPIPLWPIAAVVSLAVAVLLWMVLHTR